MGAHGLEESLHLVRAEDGTQLVLTELVLPSGAVPRLKHAFLLIHGLGQTRAAFELGFLPRALLERGARVFAGELRGHGRSRPLAPKDRGWGLTEHLRYDYPALIRAVARLAAVDRVHLVGHSMGGILGYAYLACAEGLASLVTFGAPVVLGTGNPEMRRLARLLIPVLERLGPRELPLDLALRMATLFSVLPERGGWRGALRDRVRLGNPHAGDPAQIRRALWRSAPASKRVFLDLLEIARSGRATIDGVDLVAAVEGSHLPVMAVVGGRDIIAPPKSVAPVARGPGRRQILELPRAAHIDVALGHETPAVAAAVWRFTVDEWP